MKTFKLFLFATLLSATLISCKKDDDGGDNGNAAEGTIRAQVEGSTFTSLDIATAANQSTSGQNTTMVIQGSDASGKAIVLIINSFDGVGTYEVTSDNVFIVAQYIEANVNNPQDTQIWVAPFENSGVTGEINVSEKTATNIKGTFNFSAKHQQNSSMREITEGSFDVQVTNN